ncbi:Synaptotagmin-3 [Diplonema papillatum]|nr:Synaptotagmin-3 [Diplonema papillatum]
MSSAPSNGTSAPDCSFSWGTFPEFLAIHCGFDWEAMLLVSVVGASGTIIAGYAIIRWASDRFVSREDHLIKQRIRAKGAAPRCTFAYTVTREVDQEWWRCRTCYGISSMGCCTTCALRCHKGHDLEKSSNAHHMEKRYCSCGASGRCQQNAEFDKELKQDIQSFYMESDSDGKLPSIKGVRFHWHSGVDGAYFSAVFTSENGGEDTRVFQYEYQGMKVVAMGGAGSGQNEDTAEQAIAAEWDKVYNLIDIDGDGVLSAREIQVYFQDNRALQDRLAVADQASFETLLKRLDADGDGVVDRSEFAVLVQELGLISKTPSSLEIAVHCARDLIAADKIGTSDPFVQLSGTGLINMPDNMATQVKQKNLNPVWNERFHLELAPSSAVTLSFTVLDMDKVGDPDFLGYADVMLRPNELEAIVTKSKELELKLSGRPGNAGDQAFVRRYRGKLGSLVVTLRASASVGDEQKSKKKRGAIGRTMCVECRRKLFFIPVVTETRQYMDTYNHSKRLRRLPKCVCGVHLLPDGWRDQLRQVFEHIGDRKSVIDIETRYPFAEHVSWGRVIGYWTRMCAAALNVASIAISFERRPRRNPEYNLNLSVLCVLWIELFWLSYVACYVLFSLYKLGIVGTGSLLPNKVLGAHLLRTIPIGWFPQEWLTAFRHLSQRSSLAHMRHAAARAGMVILVVGVALLFLPLPFYTITAKLAFLQYMWGDKSKTGSGWDIRFDLADMIIALNMTSNIRNVIDSVYKKPSPELRLPRKLWVAIVQRMKGPRDERFHTLASLLTFSPDERSLPLLYELFVLNGDGILLRGPHEKEAQAVTERPSDERTDDLEVALLGVGDDPRRNSVVSASKQSSPATKASPSPSVVVDNNQGWLGEATDKLQNEVERLELESIEARREVERLRAELRRVEGIASSTVQLAARRVLNEYGDQLNAAAKKQLEQSLSVAETRGKDLQAIAANLAKNTLLPTDVRKILADATDGVFVGSKDTAREPIVLPSPPVVFPPERVKIAHQHAEPANLSQPDIVSPTHPNGNWSQTKETATLGSPTAFGMHGLASSPVSPVPGTLAGVTSPVGSLLSRSSATNPFQVAYAGSNGGSPGPGSRTLQSPFGKQDPSPSRRSIADLWTGSGPTSKPSRAAKSKHLSALAKESKAYDSVVGLHELNADDDDAAV